MKEVSKLSSSKTEKSLNFVLDVVYKNYLNNKLYTIMNTKGERKKAKYEKIYSIDKLINYITDLNNKIENSDVLSVLNVNSVCSSSDYIIPIEYKKNAYKKTETKTSQQNENISPKIKEGNCDYLFLCIRPPFLKEIEEKKNIKDAKVLFDEKNMHNNFSFIQLKNKLCSKKVIELFNKNK